MEWKGRGKEETGKGEGEEGGGSVMSFGGWTPLIMPQFVLCVKGKFYLMRASCITPSCQNIHATSAQIFISSDVRS